MPCWGQGSLSSFIPSQGTDDSASFMLIILITGWRWIFLVSFPFFYIYMVPIYSYLLTDSTNYLKNLYLERDRLKMWIQWIDIVLHRLAHCGAGSEWRWWLACEQWCQNWKWLSIVTFFGGWLEKTHTLLCLIFVITSSLDPSFMFLMGSICSKPSESPSPQPSVTSYLPNSGYLPCFLTLSFSLTRTVFPMEYFPWRLRRSSSPTPPPSFGGSFPFCFAFQMVVLPRVPSSTNRQRRSKRSWKIISGRHNN